MTEVKANEKREPIKRVPKNEDSIFTAAKKLRLTARVALRNELSKSITDEVEYLQKEAEQAAKLANNIQ